MKATLKAVLATSLLLAPAAFATKVPIPIEGATLNISVQVQTQALINENGAPNGKDPSYDIYVRRTRLLANGDINQNFSYLIQVDNANFGKFGNFTGRAIVQDAWIGWAPTGITGGNVLYIDAGLLLIPISHHLLESTTNFITADVHTDEFRFPGNGFPALRETGVQLRGWWLDKKIGFRGRVPELPAERGSGAGRRSRGLPERERQRQCEHGHRLLRRCGISLRLHRAIRVVQLFPDVDRLRRDDAHHRAAKYLQRERGRRQQPQLQGGAELLLQQEPESPEPRVPVEPWRVRLRPAKHHRSERGLRPKRDHQQPAGVRAEVVPGALGGALLSFCAYAVDCTD